MAAAGALVTLYAVSPSSSRRRYPWPRYWTLPGQHVDDGFFADPSWLSSAEPRTWVLSEFLDDPCLVLLGEPGLGKSRAISDAVAELRGAGHLVHAVDLGIYEDAASAIGAIVDTSIWHEWRDGDDPLYLFLDSLDEALLHIKAAHRRLVAELTQLGAPISRLRLRISCRSADWLVEFDEQLADLLGSDEFPPTSRPCSTACGGRRRGCARRGNRAAAVPRRSPRSRPGTPRRLSAHASHAARLSCIRRGNAPSNEGRALRPRC